MSTETDLHTTGVVSAGRGEIVFTLGTEGRTASTRASAKSPLRLLTPRNAGHAAWVFVSNFGGGLLAGDELSLDVEVQAGATGYVSSQSSTKVYRSADALVSRQTLEARGVADDALLVLTPDPVVCYADARYAQRQRFEVSPTGSLVVLDWFTSGRHGRGERWKAATFRSSNEIFVGNRCIVRDVLQVDRPETDGQEIGAGLGMNLFNCFATLVLVGPRLAEIGQELMAAVAHVAVKRGEHTPIGASALRDNAGVVVRAAGRNVEEVGRVMLGHLRFVETLLGECPWRRKW